MTTFSHLQTIPGIPLEKDELYREEYSDLYKQRAILKEDLNANESKIKQLRRLDAKSRGVKPAYISRVDLIKIIEDLLVNKSPVSKAFERHEVNEIKAAKEVNEGMCAGWASRTIKYPIDKLALNSALGALAKNTDLIFMRKYKVLDVKDILRSASYSAALTKLKKQLDIAHILQDKDDQLVNKDSVIADKNADIEKLKVELQRNKTKDWEPQAIEMRQAGISVTDIAKQLGKSRTTISTYLNSPSVKSQSG